MREVALRIEHKAGLLQRNPERFSHFRRAKSGLIYSLNINDPLPTRNKIKFNGQSALRKVVKNLNYYKICRIEEIDPLIIPRDCFQRPGSEHLFDLIRKNKVK